MWLESTGIFYLVIKFLLQAFHLFDLNNDGFIDKEDLKNTYITLGRTDICDEEIRCMLSEVQ
jgi:Ca2+-binding EF-hand superfamily protein